MSELRIAATETLAQLFRRETEDFARLWLAISMEDNESRDRWLETSPLGMDKDFEHYKVITHVGYQPMDKSLLAFMRCRESIFALFERLQDRLRRIPQYEGLFWMTATPSPQFLMVWEEHTDTIFERIPRHDFFRVQAKDGSSFVLDLTGWQFGFSDWFFDFEGYVQQCLTNVPRDLGDFAQEAETFLKEVPPWIDQGNEKEQEDQKIWEHEMNDLRAFANNMTDEDIKEFGKNVLL